MPNQCNIDPQVQLVTSQFFEYVISWSYRDLICNCRIAKPVSVAAWLRKNVRGKRNFAGK
jgi:hypothetical protein